MQAGHGLLHCSRPGAAYTVKGVQTLETPCLHNTHPHRHYSYQYTDSGVEGAVSCTKCLCSNTKYSYMLTTATVTLVFTFMATEEAVEVSNLCCVMQEVSLCYLVMSAPNPHKYACLYTHMHAHTDKTCTHLEQVTQSFYFWLYLVHE